jgi:Zn-dependent metalloprotease
VLRKSFASAVGEHVRFDQVVDGLPVYGSEVSVHTDPAGRVLVVNADVFAVATPVPTPRVAPADALEAAIDEVRDEDDRIESRGPRLVLLPTGKSASPVWSVDVRTRAETLRVFVDAVTGAVAATQDLRRAATGEGRVFVPNPIFSARNSLLEDNRDNDSAALTAELVTVTLERLDGSGLLRGQWVDVTPTVGDATSATNSFLYTRSDDRFEQVNCYYHVDSIQDYLQSELGLTNANARQQPVDAHAGRFDNSFYDPFDRTLYFGDGGVDDGEDGDVIVHEYGHAIQDDQIDGFGITHEAAALGEGFGDYLAATRHDSGVPAFDGAVASWDAATFSFGSPPALRRVDTGKIYPRDLIGSVHEDGEIWSSALWSIRDSIGAKATDRIVIGSHFLMTARSGFADGAAAVLSANESLRGGADAAAIRAAFTAHGIPVPDAPVPEPVLPADDFEPNDSVVDAAALASESVFGLTLLDDDYFLLADAGGKLVTVFATFDASAVDLDLALLGPSGEVLAVSDSTGPSETIFHASASNDTGDLILRVHAASGEGRYDLTVVVTPIQVLAGRKLLAEVAADEVMFVGLLVETAGDDPRTVKVKARRRGKRGAVPEVEVRSPAGELVVPYGEGERRKGVTFEFDAFEAGEYRLAIRSRAGTDGRFRVKTRVR